MLLFAVFVTAVQAAVLQHFGGGSWPVALAVPCVVFLALHAGNIDGPLGAAAIGWFMDLWAGGHRGQLTFLAVLLFVAGRVVATGLRNPDFAAYARAFGGYGATVEKTADFFPAFDAAQKSGRPAIIHLKVDPEALTPAMSLTAIRDKALAGG